MKAWRNEKGNWCFELDEKYELEDSRFICLISKGTQWYQRIARDNPDDVDHAKAHLSAELFNEMVGEVFVRYNYTQESPTIENPYILDSKWARDGFINSKTDRKFLLFTELQLKLLREKQVRTLL